MRRGVLWLAVAMMTGCGSLLVTSSDEDLPPRSDASSDGAAPIGIDAADGTAADASTDARIDAPIDAPTDEAGPRLTAFVTSGTFAINEIAGSSLDKPCKSAAQALGLAGNFIAFMSTADIAARNRLLTGAGPWYTVKGELIAYQWSDLVNGGTLVRPLDVDEGGNTLPANEYAWTGSNFVGQIAMTCTDWTNIGQTANVGDVHATTSQWIEATTKSCAGKLHVYCFEQ